MELKATRLYYENQDSRAAVVVNRGGARSSKSHSLMQLFLTRFFGMTHKSFLIVRKTSPSMRMSVYRKFLEVSRGEFGLDPETQIRREKQYLNFYWGTNLLHFGAIDDPEKIKSTEWNYIWMEEANEFDLLDFRSLNLRKSAASLDGAVNQMFLSFNPIDIYHWIKTELLDKDPAVQEIHSTYRDNPFLNRAYVEELLRLEKQDPNFFRIYVMGEWGKLENLIYPENWEVVPADKWPERFDDQFRGLDFGFTNSPTALLKLGTLETEPDTVYESEELYATGMTNNDLISFLKTELDSPESPIYADEAEPARIEEMYREGINVVPVNKKAGFVLDSIGAVKKVKVKVHENSINLIKERRGYSWRTDRSGRVIDVPVKYNDHLMDGEKTAIYQHLGGSTPAVWLI